MAQKRSSVRPDRGTLAAERRIVTRDPQFLSLLKVAENIAASYATVLVQGESGTGKELVATALHRFGANPDGPFVPINCGAIPDTLLESELFGHRRGAFTGADTDHPGAVETARDGTLFLDEVGELPPALQVKLLRILQDRQFERIGDNRLIEVDTRVLLATNTDLEKEMEEGRFRQDLFYRINVINIEIPPLRDRPGDIPLLVSHFIRAFKAKTRKPIDSISPEALAVLTKYSFPGNVRELENALERAMATCEEELLSTERFEEAVEVARTVRDKARGDAAREEALELRAVMEQYVEQIRSARGDVDGGTP